MSFRLAHQCIVQVLEVSANCLIDSLNILAVGENAEGVNLSGFTKWTWVPCESKACASDGQNSCSPYKSRWLLGIMLVTHVPLIV